MEPSISIEEIYTEVDRLIQPLSFNTPLDKLQEYVQALDFSIGNIKEGQVDRKVVLVMIIEHLFELADTHHSGFALINDSPHFYNGFYWEEVSESVLKTFLRLAAIKTEYNSFESKYYRFVDDLLKQFYTLVPQSYDTVDSDKVLINLKNGTFEISKEKQILRAFKKEDYLTYQLPFAFEPSATSEKFCSFLDKVLPDKPCQAIIAEYIAYSFTNLKLEKALILYGTGANGKSVLFEIVNSLLGRENISNYPLSSLSKEGTRPQIANKLINYCSELEDRIDRTAFKLLVSGEPIDARNLYSKPFLIYKYAKLWFNANRLPQNPEISDGFFRRLLIIPFEVVIPSNERNPNLAKEIATNECSGIFNWVLEGLNRVLANQRFTNSDKVNNLLNDFREESDSAQSFINESNYCRHSRNHILLTDLYVEYQMFCSTIGVHALSKTNFNRRLKNNGILVKRANDGNRVYIDKKVII